MPRVTVVMRTKNSDWVVGEALEALDAQHFEDYELLVVDSGSTDDTLNLVRQYPHRLIEIEASSYYPGPVLNMAIEQAHSPLVVLLNSDSVMLSPHSLGNLIEVFDHEDVAAAYGRQIPRPEAWPWVRRDYAASFPVSDSAPWIGLSFPLAAIRKSVWNERQLYSESWGSEDTEWGVWARRVGKRVDYVPEAITMHSHNYTMRQLYGRLFIEGEADAFIYAERPPTSPWRMAARAIKKGLQDIPACTRAGQPWRAPEALVRRAYGEWAYFRGHLHGSRRRRAGGDASHGQQVVLTRYEK